MKLANSILPASATGPLLNRHFRHLKNRADSSVHEDCMPYLAGIVQDTLELREIEGVQYRQYRGPAESISVQSSDIK